MRILIVKPLCLPEAQEISGTLESMQEIVGGRIQAIFPFDDPVGIVANDEGKILGLPPNRALRDDAGEVYDILCGTFFICGLEEDSFCSLTGAQIERYGELFSVPDRFIQINGKLVILPISNLDRGDERES